MVAQADFPAPADEPAPAPAAAPGSNLLSMGLGAVAGIAGTLVTKLGVEKLLDNSPFIGLAVFSIVAGFIVFVVGLLIAQRSLRLVTALAVLLILVGLGFGGLSAAVGPQKLAFVLRAMPSLTDAPTIEIAGAERAQLAWGKDLTYHVGRAEPVTLNLASLNDYYGEAQRKAQANCLQEVQLHAANLGIGDPRRR